MTRPAFNEETSSDMIILNPSSLKSMQNSGVSVPTYERSKVKGGILHLSVGNFHRAHQCVYLDQLLESGKGFDYGIVGAGLLDIDQPLSEALKDQECLFTVTEQSMDLTSTRVVGSMLKYITGFSDWKSVVTAIEDPEIKIISLTITESGYYVDKASGELLFDHPAVAHDLKRDSSSSPKTAYGYLAAGLKSRLANGAAVTLLSCDNLQGNGEVLRHGLLSFVNKIDPDLARLIEQKVTFPNCMVDRITPRATKEDSEYLRQKFNVIDSAPVVCEDYLQWVIEDNFCAGRPELEAVGVQFTSDVKPYEKMKIRLLNAGHSSMGYIGYLLGYRYINEIAKDPDCVAFTRNFMDHEATPTLDALPGVDFDKYKDTLIKRFANPHLQDQALRICSDGSGKISGFVLPTVRDCLAKNLPISASALLIASWIRFLSGTDEQGLNIPIEDPMGEKLSALAQKGHKDPILLLAEADIFGDLGTNHALSEKVRFYLESLYDRGARETLQAFNKEYKF